MNAQFWRKARGAAGLATTSALRSIGFELVKRSNFYSPLPDVAHLPSWVWPVAHDLRGVDLRLSHATALVETLREYVAEFAPPRDPTGLRSFYLDNGGYGSVDAEILYAMLRHVKPARVFELGSGASSHVIAEARTANASDGCPLSHTIFDPFPFRHRMGPVAATVHRHRAEDLDLSIFDALASGDVLFVDTTHTVKTGGDVPRLILDVFPRVAPGVLIHIHDIFLPYEYPKDWVVDEKRAWAEQYLLQAFLAYNDSFEVVMPAYAVARAAPEVLQSVVPSFDPAVVRPGAFWLTRKALVS